jgi:acetyl-CoA acyltransferase 1
MTQQTDAAFAAVDWPLMQNTPQAMDCLLPMGITSETVVREYGLQRHVLDDFAVQSHTKAAAAQQAGHFTTEICPVRVGNDTIIRQDDGIRPTTTTIVLAKLKPAFLPAQSGGITTAGNSSQTTDGAAAVLLMTRYEAQRRKLPILAVWKGHACVGVPPRIMGIGPAYAIPAVLQQLNLSQDDIDMYEINEAFASQAWWCSQKLGLDTTKVNPNGGAIALGHPLGCTGTRMIVTLIYELHRRQRQQRHQQGSSTTGYGVVSMCIGSGMGAAAVLQVEPTSGL